MGGYTAQRLSTFANFTFIYSEVPGCKSQDVNTSTSNYDYFKQQEMGLLNEVKSREYNLRYFYENKLPNRESPYLFY